MAADSSVAGGRADGWTDGRAGGMTNVAVCAHRLAAVRPAPQIERENGKMITAPARLTAANKGQRPNLQPSCFFRCLRLSVRCLLRAIFSALERLSRQFTCHLFSCSPHNYSRRHDNWAAISSARDNRGVTLGDAASLFGV